MSEAGGRPQGGSGGMQGLQALQEGLVIAVEALRANLLRSILTVLGVAVGVSVVVAIASIITGIRTGVMEAFESAGPNNFIVMRFDFTAVRISDEGNDRPPWWNKPQIEPREARRIETLPTVDRALYNFGFGVDIDFEDRSIRGVQSQGYSSGWPAYQPGEFVVGRDFTPAEVQQNRSVVVISAPLATELFGRRDPMGRRVRVSSPWRGTLEEFTIIGVFEAEENIFSSFVEHWAVFPYTAASRRLRMSDWQAQILVVPHDTITMARVQDDVTALLRGLRGLGPREENSFALLASDQILDMFNRLTGVFFLVVLLLASAGMLVGGVGVIGIMLISVTERTREIGIRKAVGATRREILWQFLVEASILTALGAMVGMGAGWTLSEVVANVSPLPARIPLWSIAAALGMAVIAGMLFGLLPAYRASRLDPVDALRYE